MTLHHQQVLELLASHFQADPSASPVDWDANAWKAWRQRMETLTPPAPHERLTEPDEIGAAAADFDALVGIAADYEDAGDHASASEVYEFVRSTAARQLGPHHRVTEDATVGLIRVRRGADAVRVEHAGADRLDQRGTRGGGVLSD